MAALPRTGWVLIAVAAAALAGLIGIVVHLNPQLGSSPLDVAERAARSFVDDAVDHGSWSDPAAARDAHGRLADALAPAGLRAPIAVTVTGIDEIDSNTQRAELAWAWQTDPHSRTKVPDWHYTSTLEIVRQDLTWKAVYAPEVVHPELHADAEIAVEAEQPVRGDILGAGEEVLASEEPVIVVGIEPARTQDPAATARAAAEALAPLDDLDAEALEKRVRAADPHAFVNVMTIREDDYRDVADAIRPIPGTVFRSQRMSVPVHRGLAPLLLGRVGEATADDLRADPLLREGDLVGRSGLQKAYQTDLIGTTGVQLTADGTTILTTDPVKAAPVRTTIERRTQLAADAAAGRVVGQQAAGEAAGQAEAGGAAAGKAVGAAAGKVVGAAASIVVIDTASGEIRAVADAAAPGADSASYERALTAGYADSPAEVLSQQLAADRTDSQAQQALGIERIELGYPPKSSGGHGSPAAAAIAAAHVLDANTGPGRLITAAGGQDLPAGPAVPAEAALTEAERTALRSTLDGYQPGRISRTGEAWAIAVADGRAAVAVLEPAAKAGSGGADVELQEAAAAAAAAALTPAD